ncbi:MAG: hypothetical protein Q9190_007890 [Brigantiaea leucoxantha]
MSGVVIKLGSLLIKTLSKPVANYIKAQAREHASFRKFCVAGAQRIHRLDMRLRLGLLQDSASIEKQIAREAAEAQARKQKAEAPTVKTEAQTKADEAATAKAKKDGVEKAKAASKPKIRPLSEAKAIDAGANFASETFLLSVGVGLIIFERWWSGRKETTRREDVAEKIADLETSEKNARRALVELEKEILRLRAKDGKKSKERILPEAVWKLEEKEEEEDQKKSNGLLGWLRRPTIFSSTPPSPAQETTSQSSPSKQGGSINESHQDKKSNLEVKTGV